IFERTERHTGRGVALAQRGGIPFRPGGQYPLWEQWGTICAAKGGRYLHELRHAPYGWDEQRKLQGKVGVLCISASINLRGGKGTAVSEICKTGSRGSGFQGLYTKTGDGLAERSPGMPEKSLRLL